MALFQYRLAMERLAYSPAEAAEVIGISRAGVYNELAAGRLRARKLGGRTLILAAELEDYVAALPRRPARALVADGV